jgi:hypothetical protein
MRCRECLSACDNATCCLLGCGLFVQSRWNCLCTRAPPKVVCEGNAGAAIGGTPIRVNLVVDMGCLCPGRVIDDLPPELFKNGLTRERAEHWLAKLADVNAMRPPVCCSLTAIILSCLLLGLPLPLWCLARKRYLEAWDRALREWQEDWNKELKEIGHFVKTQVRSAAPHTSAVCTSLRIIESQSCSH